MGVFMLNTLKINFILAVTTAFVLLSMYSLDYASDGFTLGQRKALNDLIDQSMNYTLADRQSAALVYLYSEGE
jgi:hypothetical protein